MTANQLILLLDVYRGFNPSRHLGTLDKDLVFLLKNGYIETGGHTYNVTAVGNKTVEMCLEIAALYCK